jgi:hypothetical protein
MTLADFILAPIRMLAAVTSFPVDAFYQFINRRLFACL